MPSVLGIQVGHDASAAVVIDGTVVAAAAEERFNRVKHSAEPPVDSIAFCLSEAGLRLEDLDEVAVARSGSLEALLQLMNLAFRGGHRGGLLDRSLGLAKRLYRERGPGVPEHPPLYHRNWKNGPLLRARLVPHHLAHAASAFYTSGWSGPTLVVTADGVGYETSIGIWRASLPARFELLYSAGREGSLGFFYGLVTEALGWQIGDGEGKTMGLAAYGSTTARGALDRYRPRYASGRLARPHDFGRYAHWSHLGTHHWHLEEAGEVQDLAKTYGREALAAEAQRVLEREMVPLVRHWLDRERTRAACFAGGVMLNVKLNQRLRESGALDEQHVFPDAGDGGLAVGAALLRDAELGSGLAPRRLDHLYWGPAFDDAAIESLLRERRLPVRRADDVALAAAERLAAGRSVGWFQGRMEAGPRALGGRSILVDPTKAENKDALNARVKYREPFRPFCPSMTPGAAAELLGPGARNEAFMITSFDVRPDQRARIPAVVHADGTARPQVVDAAVNPRFQRLLVEFGRRSGVECLLNTSFNVKGEPIVCHPREAIRCFFDTGLDSLVLGSFILDKEL